MSVTSTRAPQKIPISQIIHGWVEVVRDLVSRKHAIGAADVTAQLRAQKLKFVGGSWSST